MAVSTNDELTLEIFLTREGADLLREELVELLEVTRPASLRRVQSAFQAGDGEGGTEVTAARWEQDRIERRIRRLEDQLRLARIVDVADLDVDRIALGHRVDVRRADGTERTYVLVSPVESSPARGRLSIESPLGAALVGRRVGDVLALPHNNAQITVVRFGTP